MVSKSSENKENESVVSKEHTYRQWIFSLLANCTHLVYGMECGWISPTTKILQSESSLTGYPLTDDQIAWIASCMGTAAMCVVILHSYISDRYGRKFSVILIAVLEAISWIIRAVCSLYTWLVIARICAGIAAGGCYSIIPMYVKEISRNDIRGTLCTFSMILQTVGVFLMYFIGAYLDYNTVIYIVVGLPIVTILGMLMAPESPEYLVKRGKIDKAIETVAYMRGLDKEDKVVQNILVTMTQEASHVKSQPDVTVLSILKNKSWRRGFILMVLAFTFFEGNGAFTIITYASTVLSSTGVDFIISPEMQALSFPVVMMVASLTLAVCIEKYGRKPLLIGSYVVSSCCMFTIAAIIIVQNKNGGVPGWLPVIIMMLSVAMYCGGVCPITFIMLAEIFTFQIRAKVMGIVITYGWCLTALSLRLYSPIANGLGAFAPFLIYGVINVCGAIFTIFYLTETKGKTEQKILQDLMREIKTENEISHIE